MNGIYIICVNVFTVAIKIKSACTGIQNLNKCFLALLIFLICSSPNPNAVMYSERGNGDKTSNCLLKETRFSHNHTENSCMLDTAPTLNIGYI